MTPAEISILADAVKAETALDGQVALALGWTVQDDANDPVFTRRVTRWWISPGGNALDEIGLQSSPPPYLTSLDALAAECKRRGFGISLLGPIGPTQYWQVEVGEDCLPSYASTPATALCAALLRAVAADKEATDDRPQ